MKLAMQRRSIYLEPPRGMDLFWVADQFSTPEISEMFVFGDDVRNWHVRAGHRIGTLVIGIMRRVVDRRRIGFVCAAAPTPDRKYWELMAAIPDRKNRDGFAALHAMDTFCCYLFDHVKIDVLAANIRMDNPHPMVLTERAGYRRVAVEEQEGHMHAVYLCDQDAWAKRKARLERGEAAHPTGLGGPFVILPGPPYNPVLPPEPAEG